MASPARLEIVARSWALEMLVRVDDVEAWVTDAVRFPSEYTAERHGQWLLAQRQDYIRFRVLPSALPPTIQWLCAT